MSRLNIIPIIASRIVKKNRPKRKVEYKDRKTFIPTTEEKEGYCVMCGEKEGEEKSICDECRWS